MDVGGVRATSFLIRQGGYDIKSVRDTLDAVATEVGAGRSPEGVIDEARFRTYGRFGGTFKGYDIDAVDWFLSNLGKTHALDREPLDPHDPWCSDPVVNLLGQSGSHPESLHPREIKARLADQCQVAWQRVGELPGVRLTFAGGSLIGGPWPVSSRLEGRRWTGPTAWAARIPDKLSIAGYGYRLLPAPLDDESNVRLAEIAYCDNHGNHQAFGRWSPQPGTPKWVKATRKFLIGVRSFVGPDSRRRFTVSGATFAGRSVTRITLPDGSWLRVFVRGTKRSNAVMTAVTNEGIPILRFRNIDRQHGSIEVVIHPKTAVTQDVMAIAVVTAPLMKTYFQEPGGGGG